MAIPDCLECSQFLQDRAGYSRLSAEIVLFTVSRRLQSCALRLLVNSAESLEQLGHLTRYYCFDDGDGRSRCLRISALAPARQKSHRLLCSRDADATACRHYHTLFSDPSKYRLD